MTPVIQEEHTLACKLASCSAIGTALRKRAAIAGQVVLSASVALHSLSSSRIYKTALIVLSCNYIWRQETASFDSSSPNAFKLLS